MASRYLNGIEINDSYTFPSADGTDGQFITTDGAGNLSFVSVNNDKIVLTVKNISGGSLSKGTVVHASPSATPPSGNVLEVIAADKSAASTMPAIGVLNETLADEGEGECIAFGSVTGIDTSSFSASDPIYVGASGGFTATKPSGTDLIQKIGIVVKVHASNGSIKVFGANRTNDVPAPLYVDIPNGRVGVGTPTPSRQFVVENNSGDAFAAINCGNNASTHLLLGSTADDDAGKIVYDSGNISMDFYTDNTKQVEIDSSGKVGIGVNGPSRQLHVYDTNSTPMRVESNTSDTKIEIKNTSGTQYVQGSANNLLLGTNNTERMRIDSSGNVGIGATSPTRQLVIQNSSGDAYAAITAGNNAISHLLLGSSADDDAGKIVYDSGNIAMEFYTDGDKQVEIDSSGKVGIGIGGPTQKLHVYDTNNNVALIESNTSSTKLNIKNTSGTHYIDANANDIRFATNGTERMRLENDGDLHVDGDVIAASTTVPSDKRLKDDIKTIHNALEKVEAMRGVSYTWNKGKRKGQSEIGVIAQEVEKVFPEIVKEKEMPMIDGETYKTVDYEKMVGVLIEAVKELSAQVKELKEEI
jgi:hypothetical protein